MDAILMILLLLTAGFLILLVLVQRGRGGGLAGALGGMGGQSAFGTKAGDTFTRITIVVAAFWIVLCAASVKLLGTDEDSAGDNQVTTQSSRNGATPGKSGKRSTGAAPAPKGAGNSSTRGSASPPAGSKPAGQAAAPRSGSPAPSK